MATASSATAVWTLKTKQKEDKMLSGFDTHCDQMGIVLDEEFICGDCKTSMNQVSSRKYHCPGCNTDFFDKNEENEK